MSRHKVVIVGTGPAGLTAAIYAARAALEPVVFCGLQPGGQLTTTTDVENFPGFKNGIQGPELMQEMTAQAERFGAKMIYEEITKVDFSTQPLTLWAGEEKIEAYSVIIATGATAKTLNLPDEDKLMGRGISTCATCDGFFYKNKKVLIIGGGDSAMEEATYLAGLCSEVVLIHRRNEFRASPIMLDRVRKNPKIKIMTPYTVDATINDKNGVAGVKLRNLENNQVSDFTIAGLFYAIGHTPNSKPFLPFVDVDEQGYIKVTDHTKTKTPGVFAAGDISDPHFKQAITAAGMGCQAALQAQRYIETISMSLS